jgi:hypothetical protein
MTATCACKWEGDHTVIVHRASGLNYSFHKYGQLLAGDWVAPPPPPPPQNQNQGQGQGKPPPRSTVLIPQLTIVVEGMGGRRQAESEDGHRNLCLRASLKDASDDASFHLEGTGVPCRGGPRKKPRQMASPRMSQESSPGYSHDHSLIASPWQGPRTSTFTTPNLSQAMPIPTLPMTLILTVTVTLEAGFLPWETSDSSPESGTFFRNAIPSLEPKMVCPILRPSVSLPIRRTTQKQHCHSRPLKRRK